MVSLGRHCMVLLTKWCCSKPFPAYWLRPGHGVVSACVVLFQAQRGAAEGIVLSSCGYCPRLTYTCLFILLVSLSGQRQFHAMGPPCSHSHSTLTSALSLQSQAEESVHMCVRACMLEMQRWKSSVCDWRALFAKTAWVGLLHSIYLGFENTLRHIDPCNTCPKSGHSAPCWLSHMRLHTHTHKYTKPYIVKSDSSDFGTVTKWQLEL